VQGPLAHEPPEGVSLEWDVVATDPAQQSTARGGDDAPARLVDVDDREAVAADCQLSGVGLHVDTRSCAADDVEDVLRQRAAKDSPVVSYSKDDLST